jgi:hypothetical protein
MRARGDQSTRFCQNSTRPELDKERGRRIGSRRRNEDLADFFPKRATFLFRGFGPLQ